jgi:LemA protein
MKYVIVIAVLVFLGLITAFAYNSLIRRRNQVENAWAQIDVQLKRRLDLIPNLVNTVKGASDYEKSTLDAVIQARNSAVTAAPTPGAQANAASEISGALGRLFALSEAYPDLKANQGYITLQEELTDTEGRVGYARQFYNDAVTAYNNKLDTFPTMIFARIMKFGRREYFEADDSARQAPNVTF